MALKNWEELKREKLSEEEIAEVEKWAREQLAGKAVVAAVLAGKALALAITREEQSEDDDPDNYDASPF